MEYVQNLLLLMVFHVYAEIHGMAIHVLVGAHTLLNVTNVHDASCAIRSSFPGARANEKNADQ